MGGAQIAAAGGGGKVIDRGELAFMAGRFRKHVADIVAGPRTKQREAALGGTAGEMLAIAGYDEIGSRRRESPCAPDSEGNEAPEAPSCLPALAPEAAPPDPRASGPHARRSRAPGK